jgi:hypothetical protein
MSGNSTAAMEAYRLSCFDARLRHVIRREELIYDPTRQCGYKGSNHKTIWSFRFKESAGQSWTRFDPWHNHTGQARRMVFLPDGRVAQVVDDPNLLGITDHHDAPLRLCQPFTDADDNAGNEDMDDDDEDGYVEDNAPSGLDIRWRLVTQPIDLPPRGINQSESAGDDGIAYIRLTVAGRDVPTYIVHRSPTGNWGFLMENCWGVFASFPLPCKAKYTAPEPFMSDGMPTAGTSSVTTGLPSLPQPQAFSLSERYESSSSGDGQSPLPILNEYLAKDIDDILFLLDDDGVFSENSEDSDTSSAADNRLHSDPSLSRVHQPGRVDSSSAEGMKMTPAAPSMDYLLSDAFLTVTNHWQWREAFLYNIGSSIRLPDGPHALADFYRIWSRSTIRGLPMLTTTTAMPYTAPPFYPYHHVDPDERDSRRRPHQH